MKRDNAFFDGSRLYRQAEEGSNKLLESFRNINNPFHNSLRYIFQKDEIIISCLNESEAGLNVVRTRAFAICKRISPYIALPILIEAITNYYYGDTSQKPFWLGTALKYTLAIIAGNTYKASYAGNNSVKSICEAVAIVGVLEQFQAMNMVYEVFDNGITKITQDGLQYDDVMRTAYAQLGPIASMKGKVLRTARDSNLAIWEHPIEAIEAIENVLAGQSPKEQLAFEGTIFNEFPSDISKDFWADLWLRLNMAAFCVRFRGLVTNNPIGVAIFSDFGLATNQINFESKNGQAIVKKFFWNKEWYEGRIKDYASSLIVERPVVRISNDKNLYATSLFLISDSLNWFVESSIFNQTSEGGIKLPESVFQKCISKPFEQNTLDVFTRFGFLAGCVNDNGVWQLSDKDVQLENIHNWPFPGEIDVLAYHEREKLVFVLECKVLRIPFTANNTRNIVYKLGEIDDEKFHSKLDKKISWLAETIQFAKIQRENMRGAIILDRMMPGFINKSNHKVLDLGTLEDLFEKLFVNQ